MIEITTNAIDDITEYYSNAMMAHPNTWNGIDVNSQIEKVLYDIRLNAEKIVKRLSIVHGQVESPLLVKMKTNGMVEAFAKKSKWYFTLRYDSASREYYIDNAIKGENMSNRAHRRGSAAPNAPLEADDRSAQIKVWENTYPTASITKAEPQSGNLFQQCACEVLSEERRKIGEYEVIEGSGIMGTCRAPSIKQFGWFAELCMYYSKAHTYCLHLRKKTDKGFFCEIVPAPELGENETKYVPRHLSEIPVAIRQDALQMILVQKMWRNRLSKQKR